MKNFIKEIEAKVIDGIEITYEDSIKLMGIENEDEFKALLDAANNIRVAYKGNEVELCTIINAKSGKCSEDCRYCAQSAHYNTCVQEYDLLDYESILKKALEVQKKGVNRFSLVTSGRGLNEEDLIRLVDIYKKLKQDTTIKICASHGIISYEQAVRLKEAGVDMYHHNLETGKDYYGQICTTHSFEDRVQTVRNLLKAGMDVCSGGIIGMDETVKDRIDMAFTLKELNVKSTPVNILNPVKGTPCQDIEVLNYKEALKTMAVFRFILPHANIRYAGGRMALEDKQQLGLLGGVNSLLTGDYLTTTGSDIEGDKQLVTKLGYEIAKL